MWFFTSDEHYGHVKILLAEYCNRRAIMAVLDVQEMNEVLISNHNEVVTSQDVTIHAGDFCWHKKTEVQKIIKRLNGTHIFLRGSHDAWLPASAKCRWRKMIDGHFIVVDHYAGRTWERAHHGSYQLYGHSHGRLEPEGLQHDVGVDNNNFYPVSFDQIVEIMADRKQLEHRENPADASSIT